MTRHVQALVALVCTLSALLMGCTPASTVGDSVDAIHETAARSGPGDGRRNRDRDVAVLEWAAELGLSEPFNEAGLRREYESVQDGGRPAHGVTSMEYWDFYLEHLTRTENMLKARIRDGLSLREVRAYYDDNLEDFARQDTIEATVIPWEDGRAGEVSSITIDELSVRALQERDDELVAAALQLDEGEEVVVELSDGRLFQVICESREPGGHLPFDDVVQAASSQLAAQRFEQALAERMDEDGSAG